MRLNGKSSGNRSMLNLNISLIEETSKPSKHYTPREATGENNPERPLKTVSSQMDLMRNSPRDKLHMQFTKYESTLTLNTSLNSKSTTNLDTLQMKSPSSKNNNPNSIFNSTNHNQPKRPRILSKLKPTVTPLIDQFKPIKTLGKGRFGNVSMVRHTLTGTVYALKDISTDKMSSKWEQRLLAEIKIQSFLEHKHCLQLYKCFSENKHLYLLLELGQQSLFQVLRKKRCLGEAECAYYLRQVIAALIHMHDHGIIHRDLKPENIIIVNGVAKLADFGWAVYTPKEKRITHCGTLDYLSPEILTGERYDEMVDVWSVGVLCYELCTGHAPFESRKNREQANKKILNVDLVFPKHMSETVRDFISRLLVRDPSKRMSLQEAMSHPWMKKYGVDQ